jgi:hypothetical protein
METSYSVVCELPLFIGMFAAWGLTCLWLGYLLADRRRPRRFIMVEDSGAWTVAKFHSVDNRNDDDPIAGLPGVLPTQVVRR